MSPGAQVSIVAGAEFRTQSVRVSLFSSGAGRLGSGVAEYPVVRSVQNSTQAIQSHTAQMKALEDAFHRALEDAGVDGQQVRALAVDTTGSSVIPVDDHLQPLDDYALWCDHRAWREAQEITEKAHASSLEAIDWCGGAYSSEWGFAKLLYWMRHNPGKRDRLATAPENCDMVPPEDELFAAIEGTALHTRIILDRMAEKESPVHRVINGGGIPRRNNALNRVYANALNRPVLVPSGDVTSRGSAIFAFLASGDFKSIEEAQTALCPASVTFVPDAAEAAVYDRLYRDLYFPLGQPNSAAVRIGHILPKLREIAAESQTLSREAQ